ncbi:DUF2147 domain-containing protein [soil metagenome]
MFALFESLFVEWKVFLYILYMKLFTIILLSTFTISLQAQSIYGKWNTGRGGIIEIYECGSLLCGKLVNSNEPNRLDSNNPDPSKRNDKLLGTNILRSFEKSSNTKWVDGKIYNPNNGKSYSAKLILVGDVLKVRGFKGFSLFGKTVKWSRVQ